MYLHTLSHSAIAGASRRRWSSIQVEEANPFEAVDRVERATAPRQGAALAAIDAVERRILRDEQ